MERVLESHVTVASTLELSPKSKSDIYISEETYTP